MYKEKKKSAHFCMNCFAAVCRVVFIDKVKKTKKLRLRVLL